MKRNLKRVGALVLASAMMASALTGCGDSAETKATEAAKTEAAATEAATETAKTEAATEAAPVEFSYPMSTDETLTYWVELNANVAANYNKLGDTPFGQALMEQTGVNIEYTHPAVGQTSEAFNLLLSDKVLPDIIEYSWLGYSGGPEKAIKDGVIIPLNDIIDQYCPNLKAYLEANPVVDRMVKTDEGTYYCFPFIRGGDTLLTAMGPFLRGDWLEELGLEVPTTIEEWEIVLTKFKEEKGATAPFSYQYTFSALTDNNPFAYAYGVNRNFYLDDEGKVVFGAVQDGYKEYLQLMNKWMEAGLIDIDLLTLTGDQVAAKVTNGSAGASFAYCGSGMGNWTAAARATNEEFTLVAAPYPTLVKGEKPEMGQRDNYYTGLACAAISTSCENIELAARFLDYAYGEAGNTLYNFGIEGTSYEMVDGEPHYTDLLLKNPDGLSITHAMGGYIRANYNGPFVQAESYAQQYYTLDTQREAIKTWANTNMGAHVVPPISPTSDEAKEQSQIMNEINTYRDQYTIKFILGDADFSEWDTYVETIYSMGLDRVLEIQNSALDRYNAR